MHERYEILVMLLVAGFFSSSFWPVVCGWVDLMTLAGWLTLLAGFGELMIACAVLGLVISLSTLLSVLPGFLLRSFNDPCSTERRVIIRGAHHLKLVTTRFCDTSGASPGG